MSNNINKVGQQPDMVNVIGSNPKGVSTFFGDKDNSWMIRTGREIAEDILEEDFILYRVDLKKTQPNFYGEAKLKVWKTPVTIKGRINVEVSENTYHQDGGLIKKGFGNFTAHIYIEHLEELNLIVFEEGQRLVYDVNEGDFIAFKGQVYEIKDNGSQLINNQSSIGGDRRFMTSIKAVEVSDSIASLL